MISDKKNSTIKIIVAAAYVVMVAVNALAVILPIGGVGTNEVSDAYPNLFAPPPLTFAVWGVIYVLLAMYILYQIGLFHGEEETPKEELIKKVGTLFTVSSLFNCAWIFSWHYQIIWASLILITGLLASPLY